MRFSTIQIAQNSVAKHLSRNTDMITGIAEIFLSLNYFKAKNVQVHIVDCVGTINSFVFQQTTTNPFDLLKTQKSMFSLRT